MLVKLLSVLCLLDMALKLLSVLMITVVYSVDVVVAVTLWMQRNLNLNFGLYIISGILIRCTTVACKNFLLENIVSTTPIVIACLLWGHLWCRKKITVFCDNKVTVHIINNGRASVSFINRLVRRLMWTSVLDHSILQQGCFGAYVDTLLESVFFTAFYGFLRCGEFTTRCATFDPYRDLTMSDVFVASDMFTVFLKHSKNWLHRPK